MSAAQELAARVAQAMPFGLGNASIDRPRQAYQLDTAFIPWAHQPALLEEYALARELDIDGWLARAGVCRGQMVSPRQLLALLAPLQRAARDSAFVLGGMSLPGHYGLASHALQDADNLLEALRRLVRFAARLSPLLTPRLLVHDKEVLLYWTEACGMPHAQRCWVVDMQMAAVSALAHDLAAQPVRWQYSFNRTRPADLSQHATYLGTRLQFDCLVDAVRIGLDDALRPRSRTQRPVLDRAALAAQADPVALTRGLRAALYDYLLSRSLAESSLGEAAAWFQVSPATLKRHLSSQGSHFQAEVDLVLAHLSLYLMHVERRHHGDVALALGFKDSSNFRRSFKRWTGLTPAALAGAATRRSPSTCGVSLTPPAQEPTLSSGQTAP